MSLDREKFHALQYKSSAEGCLGNLTGFFNHDRFQWSPYENHPGRLEIRNEYTLALSDSNTCIDGLDFDFFEVSVTYVSQNFLNVGESLGAKYRAIPLEISQ
ncbi:hypothetical protein [Pseudomonas sp.]|uniref:hypothetical protein n=1 Tax=Pseudomonas sp. TaxID=306 RepID=UPI0028B05CEB|nr:hypothetical protein [Pseudomonas sp.]